MPSTSSASFLSTAKLDGVEAVNQAKFTREAAISARDRSGLSAVASYDFSWTEVGQLPLPVPIQSGVTCQAILIAYKCKC